MKKKLAPVVLVIVLCGFFALGSPAQTAAPPKLQAALFIKLLGYYTNLGNDPFTITVIGAPEVAKEFRAFIGKKVGKAKLAGVSETEIAASKVIYVGERVKALTRYSRENQVLTITGNRKFVNEGVTLGIGIEYGKPKILLNLSSSKAEGINWNPAILKVAQTML